MRRQTFFQIERGSTDGGRGGRGGQGGDKVGKISSVHIPASPWKI